MGFGGRNVKPEPVPASLAVRRQDVACARGRQIERPPPGRESSRPMARGAPPRHGTLAQGPPQGAGDARLPHGARRRAPSVKNATAHDGRQILHVPLQLQDAILAYRVATSCPSSLVHRQVGQASLGRALPSLQGNPSEQLLNRPAEASRTRASRPGGGVSVLLHVSQSVQQAPAAGRHDELAPFAERGFRERPPDVTGGPDESACSMMILSRLVPR